MTRRIIGHRAWEITCMFLNEGAGSLCQHEVWYVASLVDHVVRAAARLHKAHESRCNGTMSDERYESERRRFRRSADYALALLESVSAGIAWECNEGSGDPRGPSALIRWSSKPVDGSYPDGWCPGDSWERAGWALPGFPAGHTV